MTNSRRLERVESLPVMHDDGHHLDFSTILASSIHDMKNSLGVVLNSLDELVSSCSEKMAAAQLAKLQWEARRVNANLVQLLALYKMENQGVVLNVDEHFVHDFLEESLASEQTLLRARHIELELHCPRDLAWYFDRELIAGVLKSALGNALRYARSKIAVAAMEKDNFLVMTINDDGIGFKREFLTARDGPAHGVEFSSGNTGLGLYFASRVAALHSNKGRRGAIALDNGHLLGGACFTLMLP